MIAAHLLIRKSNQLLTLSVEITDHQDQILPTYPVEMNEDR